MSGPADRRRLRSERWFAPETMRASAHRQRTLQMGFRREDFMGKPVIAIINTWSDLSPCHAHLRERAEAVKRGVLLAGGFPVELPAMSLGEVMVKPTTMLYRNFLAMETEELLRSHPVDGAVLMGGCDKTTPGLLMGAISMDLPAIFLPAGPMLPGSWRGVRLGVGTHTRKYWDELRAGTISLAEWHEIEAGIARSPGTCMTMGTASTMTAIAEALGFVLPGGSSVPAMDADHVRLATDTGACAVQMVQDDVTPSRIMSRAAVENALAVMAAMAGSTNAAVHLIALARRAGVPLALHDFDAVARRILPLANIMPSGEYLMQDFFEAGGLRALMSRLGAELHLDCPTVNGRTIGDNIAGATVWNDRVIRPLGEPVSTQPSLAVLYGNLAPGRMRDQAERRHARAARASRPRRRVSRHQRPRGAHRPRRSRRRRRFRAGAPARGSAGRTRNAGVGQPADPEKAARARRARHGAHFGRPDERHALRHLRRARRAGIGGRRSACMRSHR